MRKTHSSRYCITITRRLRAVVEVGGLHIHVSGFACLICDFCNLQRASVHSSTHNTCSWQLGIGGSIVAQGTPRVLCVDLPPSPSICRVICIGLGCASVYLRVCLCLVDALLWLPIILLSSDFPPFLKSMFYAVIRAGVKTRARVDLTVPVGSSDSLSLLTIITQRALEATPCSVPFSSHDNRNASRHDFQSSFSSPIEFAFAQWHRVQSPAKFWAARKVCCHPQ